jgi:hypothetical protein
MPWSRNVTVLSARRVPYPPSLRTVSCAGFPQTRAYVTERSAWDACYDLWLEVRQVEEAKTNPGTCFTSRALRSHASNPAGGMVT